MRHILIKNGVWIVGALIGGIAGFAYYYYVGCPSGTCPITANPYTSIAIGAWIGGLGFSIIPLHTTKKSTKSI